MEIKHTPGPWNYGVRADGSIWLSLGCPTKGPHYQGDLVSTVPDAKLIHAAPDLLKAASEVCEAWGKFIDSFDYVPGIGDTAENIEFQEMMRLRIAINKATE